MDTLEDIIKRASCPCRDEECQRELAHVRRAVKETLELAAKQFQDGEALKSVAESVNDERVVRYLRALAATLDKEGKP